MDLNQEFTDEELENFFNPIEENPKLIEENPTPNDLNIQVPINVQEDTSNKNQNPITDLPTKNQSSALPSFNLNSIATPVSNNQSNLISAVSEQNPIADLPRKNKRSELPPLNPMKRHAPLPPLPAPKKATIVGSESSSSTPAEESLLFTFKLRSSGIFRDAIQALSDVDLNPDKLAMIEVDNAAGFKIIVQNDSTKSMGMLHLITDLDEFQCAMNFRKLSFGVLDAILEYCQSKNVGYEDLLTISSTEFEKNIYLSFQLDGDLKGKTSVKIVEVVGIYERFQIGFISVVEYKACITTDPLKKIIDLLLKKRIVTIQMIDKNVTISIDEDFSRTLQPVQIASTGVPEGKIHQSEFEFPHGDSLRKACSLSNFFNVGIQNAPDSRVLLHFRIENLGALLYIKPCINLLY